AVATRRIDRRRNQQPFFMVEAQGLDSQPADLRKLANGEHAGIVEHPARGESKGKWKNSAQGSVFSARLFYRTGRLQFLQRARCLSFSHCCGLSEQLPCS